MAMAFFPRKKKKNIFKEQLFSVKLYDIVVGNLRYLHKEDGGILLYT